MFFFKCCTLKNNGLWHTKLVSETFILCDIVFDHLVINAASNCWTLWVSPAVFISSAHMTIFKHECLLKNLCFLRCSVTWLMDHFTVIFHWLRSFLTKHNVLFVWKPVTWYASKISNSCKQWKNVDINRHYMNLKMLPEMFNSNAKLRIALQMFHLTVIYVYNCYNSL